MKRIKNVAEMIENIERIGTNSKALNYIHEGKWYGISTPEFLDMVRGLALSLQKLGVERGEKIALLADPSPFWTIADLAILLVGGVTVPIFSNISEDHFLFEVEQTECKTIFVGGKQGHALAYNHLDKFKNKISLDLTDHPEGYTPFMNLVDEGRAIHSGDTSPYHKLLRESNSHDLGTIIYTSGSTGVPKGAMLTQENIFFTATEDVFDLDPLDDRYLSILPLAHILARVLNMVMVAQGISIYYFNDIKKVGDACKEVHPTALVVVPRLLEKIYSRMQQKIEASSFPKKQIGLWAFNLANDEHDGLFKQLLHPIADRVVYSTLRDAFGGNLRVVITGGAALNPHLYHFFLEIGMPLYQGYGLTEGGIISVNLPGGIKIDTVGPALRDVSLRINEEGEVLIRSGAVMRGYYRNPEATRAVLTPDGWLKTGDKGSLDEDGYLHFEGRIKEIYKTSTGEIVSPIPIEQQLGKIPLVDMAMVIAEDRRFTTCLLFPDLEVLHSLKQEEGKVEMTDEEFLAQTHIQERIQGLIDQINVHLNRAEQIRKWKFIPKVLTVDEGELTPSMKMKRNVLYENYKDIIESMYVEEEAHAGTDSDY